MSDLTQIERIKLERYLRMESGFVLDFNNRTFGDFVYGTIKINIYAADFSYMGESKAKRLRAFWEKERNYLVGKLIIAFIDYWEAQKLLYTFPEISNEDEIKQDCLKTAERLKSDSVTTQIEAIEPNVDERDFWVLAKQIQELIKNDQPEVALDRVHTFMVRYIRELCDKYNIPTDTGKPLHSIFGEYVKYLKGEGHIESTMSERILKSSISVLESFNDVRNNQSFAHDNHILNYDESLLIFNNIASLIKFIESLERKLDSKKSQEQQKNTFDSTELPF